MLVRAMTSASSSRDEARSTVPPQPRSQGRRNQAGTKAAQSRRPEASAGEGGGDKAVGDIGQRIRSVVEAWKGVPYRMGGTDRSGIDCSAFVRGMYRDVFGCAIPRTSREQVTMGREVARRDLCPGDLVFFRISDHTRHVGAYLGEGEFGHASTSKGPVVSRLASSYWDQRFWTARRVL